jgi:hypothetical protein
MLGTFCIRPRHFILSKKACFWCKIINMKKGHRQERLGHIFFDSACLSHAKSTEQDDETYFSVEHSIHRGCKVSS